MTRVFRFFAALMIVVTGCRSEEKKFTKSLKINVAKYEEGALTADMRWLSDNKQEVLGLPVGRSVCNRYPYS